MCENWAFPESNGVTNGISDSGTETFKGDYIGSLAREICQNSLDAVDDRSKPVRVEFESIEEKTCNIPGYSDLKNVFKSGHDFWKKDGSRKEKDFFKKGLELLEHERISVLRISDFNTTGLVGFDSDKISTPWNSMVKSEGVSNKSGSSGGSFGIGKSSIFASSNLQCCFYNTFVNDDKSACQGVIKLPSFDLKGERRFGRGYYGKNSDNEYKYVDFVEQIDDMYYREENGTDIFIYGFKSPEDWERQIIISLLDNFLLAFYNDKLIVKVNDDEISKSKLEGKLDSYKLNKSGKPNKTIASVINYYHVLIDSDTQKITEPYSEIFPKSKMFNDNSGTIELLVKIFDNAPNRSVLISRSNGMKLFDKKSISSIIQFSAILTMEGKEINEYFSKMENPSHDKWEAGRHEDSKEAGKVLDDLYKWIKRKIIEIGDESFDSEVDIKGLNDIIYNTTGNESSNHEGLDYKNSKVEVQEHKKPKTKTNVRTSNTGDTLIEVEGTGFVDPNGEGEAAGGHGNGPKNNSDGGLGSSVKGSLNENSDKKTKEYKRVSSFEKRVFISNASKSEYTVNITTNKNIKGGILKIDISGESGATKTGYKIKNAYFERAKKPLKVKDNIIRFDDNVLYKGFKETIRFSINIPYLCSLEVRLYENK